MPGAIWAVRVDFVSNVGFSCTYIFMSDKEVVEHLEEVQDAVSSVYHDLNNPLSIISGNAQFLLEMSREEELDDLFVSSVQDIQEAAQQMEDCLQQLDQLKKKVDEEI